MKRITRANVMGELVDKFALQEYEREDFLFGEFVVPTYDIGNHVKTWVCEEERKAISANGATHFFLIPVTELWHVRRIDVIHETGANFDIDQVFFYGSALKHQYLFYDTTTPIVSGTIKIFDLPQDVPMKTSQLINLYINVVNFVAGGYVSVHMLKEVEIIR